MILSPNKEDRYQYCRTYFALSSNLSRANWLINVLLMLFESSERFKFSFTKVKCLEIKCILDFFKCITADVCLLNCPITILICLL